MNVKINNKNYPVPLLTFEHFVRMESELDASLVTAFKKRQMLVLVSAFVVAVTDLDGDSAIDLITQHIQGGGTIITLQNAFMEAVRDSDFFKKMFGIKDEQKQETKRITSKPKIVKTVEIEEV